MIVTAVLAGALGLSAQDLGTGLTWGTLAPGEPLLLNENFRGFTHFHSRANTNDSNSRNEVDGDGNVTKWGYKNDSIEVAILGSETGKVGYGYYQCAFAPNWSTAYAYRDSVNNGSGSDTPGISRGFVEISRKYTTHNTVDGYFILDLRRIDFVEVLQYSHSSCGGTRRGLRLDFSLDNGATWDTLRYQPGDAWASSFTKDPGSGQKTSNSFNCTPSAYGMTWEEGIYAENVMLRFTIAGNQALRIHDLKVYGTYTGQTGSKAVTSEELKFHMARRVLRISEMSDVVVYNIAGQMVRSVSQTRQVSFEGMPEGIYLVKARAGNKIKTDKILVN